MPWTRRPKTMGCRFEAGGSWDEGVGEVVDGDVDVGGGGRESVAVRLVRMRPMWMFAMTPTARAWGGLPWAQRRDLP